MQLSKDLTIKDWLGEDNQLGIDIWTNKYQHNGESFYDWLMRVSGHDNDVAQMIWEKKFLFGGRILAARGINDGKASYSNCYVIDPPEDNIESIYETCSKLARTYSLGGGCGIDISKLAPEGAKVNNQAKSTSGAVSFMDTFSQVTQQICQKGRRGALMISIDCSHPDLEKFITIKTDLNKVNFANISVRVTDKFMKAVESDADWELFFERPETKEKITKTVKAKDIFELLCKTNWDYAEPGILFWDNINNYHLQSEVEEFSYAGTNPCLTGETLILTTKGAIPIKDLVDTNPYVYCMDENHHIVIQRADKVWLTRKNASIISIYINKQIIKCTPDHLIYIKNKGWIKAQDLTVGEEVLSLRDVLYFTLSPQKITNIVLETETQDVYDMTIPIYHNFIANDIVVHNCAEEPLPASGSCLLGSLNLSAFVCDNGMFNITEFESCVELAIRALNKVQEEGMYKHPLKSQIDCAHDWKQIGMGIMGLADMLIKMGITYGSQEAIEICDNIGNLMTRIAIETSAEIAKFRGAYPKWNTKVCDSKFYKYHITKDEDIDNCVHTYGMTNSQLLTIAPTGLNIGSV